MAGLAICHRLREHRSKSGGHRHDISKHQNESLIHRWTYVIWVTRGQERGHRGLSAAISEAEKGTFAEHAGQSALSTASYRYEVISLALGWAQILAGRGPLDGLATNGQSELVNAAAAARIHRRRAAPQHRSQQALRMPGGDGRHCFATASDVFRNSMAFSSTSSRPDRKSVV